MSKKESKGGNGSIKVTSGNSQMVNNIPKGPRHNKLSNKNVNESRKGARRRSNGNHSKRYQHAEASDHSASRGSDSEKNSRPKLVTDDDFMLSRSILKSSKRGIDISHLLDYTIADDEPRMLESIETVSRRRRKSHGRRRSSYKRSPNLNLSGRYYINVNYKFIVDYRLSYKAQILDPNMPLDDATIVRVIINGKDYQCPICLSDEFVAPRMTSCGHVFCYPCLIRLFASSAAEDEKKTQRVQLPGRRSATCPLCNDVIREHQRLLPVLVNREEAEAPTPDEYAKFTLMYRPANRIFAQPVQLYLEKSEFEGNIPWIERGSTPTDFFDTSKYVKYSRLMKCDEKFILSCFANELSALKTHKEYDKEVYHDSGLYYDLATNNIDEQIRSTKKSFAEEKSGSIAAPNYNHIDHDGALTEEEINKLLIEQNNYNFDKEEKGYFFYQCLTSPNSKVKYFLSGLDVQILRAIYGEYQYFPFNLRMKLENISYEDDIVTEDMIHRLKYVGHLPVGTSVGFCQLCWIEPHNHLMPPDVFREFKKRLKERTRSTKDRKRREDHDKKAFDKELELRTLKFYASENNLPLEQYGHSDPALGGLSTSSVNLTDEFQPTLTTAYAASEEGIDKQDTQFGTSVWGTKIPLSEEELKQKEEDSQDIERIIQEAKTSQGKQGKKGRRKKRIVLSLQ